MQRGEIRVIRVRKDILRQCLMAYRTDVRQRADIGSEVYDIWYAYATADAYKVIRACVQRMLWLEEPLRGVTIQDFFFRCSLSAERGFAYASLYVIDDMGTERAVAWVLSKFAADDAEAVTAGSITKVAPHIHDFFADRLLEGIEETVSVPYSVKDRYKVFD